MAKKRIESLLFQMESYIVPSRLYGSILARIQVERRKAARVRSWYFGATSIVSLSLLIYIVGNAASAFSDAAFFNYASLIFTDADVVLSSWKEFSLLLIEALPTAIALASLTVAFVFLWSLAHALKNIASVLLVHNVQ
jgi:hypothetical protein